ncbi:glycoside hydrolase family 27 protein [Gordonia jinhuaensis]|nr:glycoside hydrolase family 27 protein [Gordonia jinhuaensis]
MTSRSRRSGALGLLVATALMAGGCSTTPVFGESAGGSSTATSADASTPPMGWNSWNTFGCDIDEKKIEAQADALVADGMARAGYRYVVVDDCWYAPSRNGDGALTADPTRFPSGMAALARYVHARGLRFGIYSGASTQMCAQFTGAYPGSSGSEGHEIADARTFASWGVDFVKYDWCSSDSDPQRQMRDFTAMRDALRSTGRPIIYSINPNSGLGATLPGMHHDWGSIATMTRATNDVSPYWTTGQGPGGYQGIWDIADATSALAQRTSSGRYVDMDMLEVGVGTALSPAAQRSQMALWAMSAAPLFAGNDLPSASPATTSLLTTRGVLAIDQDSAVSSARAYGATNRTVRTRQLHDGSIAVSMTNLGATAQSMSIALGDLGMDRDATVTDVWTNRPVSGVARGVVSMTVAPQDTALLRITPG